jgi:hypothetical protein
MSGSLGADSKLQTDRHENICLTVFYFIQKCSNFGFDKYGQRIANLV